MELLKAIKQDFVCYTRRSPKMTLLRILFFSMYYANYRAVVLYRIANYFDTKFYVLAIIVEKLMHISTITWISRKAVIGPGFVIRHVGGIVIGGKTVIGLNCEIRQGVTFGGNMGKGNYGTTQPILGDNILVGVGAKILGPVKIGDNCIIGANAVVVHDMPENSVIGGIPARVLRKVRVGENPLNLFDSLI
jgi:serine O-acetyltransferase